MWNVSAGHRRRRWPAVPGLNEDVARSGVAAMSGHRHELPGRGSRTVRVDGDRLYTLVDEAQDREAQLELRFTPGISAYAFTFG